MALGMKGLPVSDFGSGPNSECNRLPLVQSTPFYALTISAETKEGRRGRTQKTLGSASETKLITLVTSDRKIYDSERLADCLLSHELRVKDELMASLRPHNSGRVAGCQAEYRDGTVPEPRYHTDVVSVSR
ncbi:hypothetical protein J6590_007775 [Homalodisca vitripennis]|nr:hypothetical protein J6590_007775 [Homalodisca vitripennis]